MKIEKQENEKIITLLPRGNLVYEGIEELEALLKVLRDEVRCIIIDLTYTKYLSAKALSIIADSVKDYRAKRMNLKLVNVNEHIIGLFDITGVNKVISIFENEDAVLASIGPQVGKLEKNLLWSKECII
jgi:anti-sigma B factor antagonist